MSLVTLVIFPGIQCLYLFTSLSDATDTRRGVGLLNKVARGEFFPTIAGL